MASGPTYTACLVRDIPSGEWTIQLVEIPGVISEGRTITEALENVREALWAWTDDRVHARAAAFVVEFAPR